MGHIDKRLLGRKRPGPARKLTPVGEAKLLCDYCRGTKLLRIQTDSGLSKKGVYDVLRRHGVPTAMRKPKEEA